MELPALLLEAFDGNEDLLAFAGTLRDSWRRYLSHWIMQPKGGQARQRRADQVAERLLLTMETEQELPPMLGTRLRRTAHAIAGWQRMTVNTRRTYLMVFFGIRSPEAREKQLVRIVDACVAKGSRRSRT